MNRHDQGWDEMRRRELQAQEDEDVFAFWRGLVFALAVIGAAWVAVAVVALVIHGWYAT